MVFTMSSIYTTKLTDQIKVSIGLPVFNGEKFLQKCLDSLLVQTFENFELIISDNASTDKTSQICEDYSRKDDRIRYIRQKNNIGMIQNFNFVLQEAKYEYFMWIGSDDYVLPNFLKKNIEILMLNEHVVGSISKIDRFGMDFNSNAIDSTFANLIKKIRLRFRSRDTLSLYGTYEERVRSFLKRSTCQIIYGVFRTNQLRKSIIYEPFVGIDWAEILSVLKYGNFHVVDEVLMYIYEGGASTKGMINISVNYNPNFLGVIFPWYHLTSRSIKILGRKIFLKNLDVFIRLNCEGVFSQIIDLIRIITHKLLRK